MKVRIYQINDERDTFLVKFRGYENVEEAKSKANTFNVSYEKDGIFQTLLINTFSQDFAKIFFEDKFPDAKINGIKEAGPEDYKPGKPVFGTLDGPVIDSGIYDKIYDGEVECKTVEDVYTKFNLDHPEDFKGHSLSISDVVEVYESDLIDKGFYFCDHIGFKKIDFNSELCKTSERFNYPPEKMTVILLKTGELAEAVEVEHSLETFQKMVGGQIETMSLYDNDVLLVCNDEGMLNGSQLNRAVYTEPEDGKEIATIIAGDCFICGTNGENFCSLSPETTEKYMEMFKYPEIFFRAGKEIKAVPYTPKPNMQKIAVEHVSLEDKINEAEKAAETNNDSKETPIDREGR